MSSGELCRDVLVLLLLLHGRFVGELCCLAWTFVTRVVHSSSAIPLFIVNLFIPIIPCNTSSQI